MALADLVDAAVSPLQPAAPYPPVDGVLGKAGIEEIDPRDHAVLPRSDPIEDNVTRTARLQPDVTFPALSEGYVTSGGNRAIRVTLCPLPLPWQLALPLNAAVQQQNARRIRTN